MQPLSKVRSDNPDVFFGQENTMASRPNVAIKITECIFEWADTETMMAICAAFLVGGDGNATLAMYTSLENRRAQLTMLEAAARAKLQDEHFHLFWVIRHKILKPVMDMRDKFAHWSWGYSPALPNDLLLMDSREKAKFHYNALVAGGDIDRSRVFVITEQYMERALRDSRNAQIDFGDLTASIDPQSSSEKRDLVLRMLSIRPHLRTLLDRHKANLEKQKPSLEPSPELSETGK